MSGDGYPSSCGRNAQRKSQEKMGPVGKTLGVGGKKQNSECNRGKLECQRIQSPRRHKKYRHRRHRENPGKACGKRARGKRALRGAGIFLRSEEHTSELQS